MKEIATAVLGIICFYAAALSGAELPTGVKFSPNGKFELGDAQFEILALDKKNAPMNNDRWLEIKNERKTSSLTINAGLNFRDIYGKAYESFTALENNEFEMECRMNFNPPADIGILCGTISLPVGKRELFIDSAKFALPLTCNTLVPFGPAEIKNVTIPLAGGFELEVTGPVRFTIQDNRTFKNEKFELRFYFSNFRDIIEASSLTLKFKVKSVKNRTINIASVANRGFADETAGDNQGGWTDQGPNNDMRSFTSKSLSVNSLTFDMIDPAANKGNTVAVIAGTSSALPREVEVALPPGTDAGAVNLLHASGFTPAAGTVLGNVIVYYPDGSKQRIGVKAHDDVGNWWLDPSDKATLAWSSENPSRPIGLYASSFKLDKRNPVKLHFQMKDPTSMWMLVGVNLSDKPVTFHVPQKKDAYVTAGAKWLPLEYKRKTVRGSALDFSWTADAPAGKYGFVTPSRSGNLAFEKAPETRIRFYGVNLCFDANFTDKKSVDELAETLVLNGYNAVRLHHYDSGLLDRNASDSLTFDRQRLDSLDYLFSVLKDKGIYITIDFYSVRSFKPGDNIPGTAYVEQEMKALLPVSKEAMQNWKEFARRLMEHKNPYTGMTWGEDPALFAINLVNEEALKYRWSATPYSRNLYRVAFEKWKKGNGAAKGEPSDSDPVFLSFLHDIQKECLTEQLRFVKEELHLKTMFTSLNDRVEVPLTLLRDQFDLVDNHTYFDHQQGWGMPLGFRQQSAVKQMAKVPINLTPSRIFGKPYIVTEFNYCNPNIHRAEGGSLTGAYASLQDWDAVFRFAWSHSSTGIDQVTTLAATFDINSDPLAQLSDRIAMAMFLRNDVNAAKEKYAYEVPANVTSGMFQSESIPYPEHFASLGLIAQTGSVIAGKSSLPDVNVLTPGELRKPESLKDKKISQLWQRALKQHVADSATGQIALDANRCTFAVKTPRSESITLESGACRAGIVSVENADSFQTAGAISLDGKELGKSSSILVIHLTNIAYTGMHFKGEDKKTLMSLGTPPLLVYRGTANLTLSSDRNYKVVALSADGEELGPVNVSSSGSNITFKLDPGCYPGGVMAYHLTALQE